MKCLLLYCTLVFAFSACSSRTARQIQQSVTENGGYALAYQKHNRDTPRLKVDLVSLGRWLAPDSSYIQINDGEKIFIGDNTYEQALYPPGDYLFVEASSLAKVKEETRLIEICKGYDMHIVFYLINENAVFDHMIGDQ